MGRTRQIKYDACLDEDLAQLSFESRLCFLLLPTIADREGRLEDRPMKISAQIFPYDSIDAEAILEQLAMPRQFSPGAFITRYESEDGHKYVQINNFQKHQNPHPNEKQSAIPAPSEDSIKCNYISLNPSECIANTSGSYISGSYVSRSGPASDEPGGSTAAIRWEPKPIWKKGHPSLKEAQLLIEPDYLASLQSDFPRVEGNGDGSGVEAELLKMKRHALGSPAWAKKKRDWVRTFTNWLKSADERFDDARFKAAQARASPKEPAMYETMRRIGEGGQVGDG